MKVIKSNCSFSATFAFVHAVVLGWSRVMPGSKTHCISLENHSWTFSYKAFQASFIHAKQFRNSPVQKGYLKLPCYLFKALNRNYSTPRIEWFLSQSGGTAVLRLECPFQLNTTRLHKIFCFLYPLQNSSQEKDNLKVSSEQNQNLKYFHFPFIPDDTHTYH